MEDIDTSELTSQYDNEDEMFLNEVAMDEHDLLYLDSYLKETFSGAN
jgi:hypothetical protein